MLFCGCDKDDEKMVPSYRTDILCAVTDNDSIVRFLLLDDGSKYSVSRQKIKANEPDAMVRTICSYEISADSTMATIYDIKRISCYAPLPKEQFNSHPQDPINVTSVWKSGNFINLSLAPLAAGKNSFEYDFCIDSTSVCQDKTVMYVSLLFRRTPGSIEEYTYQLYHSIPLNRDYYPCPFDSLVLCINTYKGMKTFSPTLPR